MRFFKQGRILTKLKKQEINLLTPLGSDVRAGNFYWERSMNFLTKYGPVVFTIAGTIGAAIFTPDFVTGHPMAFAWVNAAAQLLHAVLPSIFGTEAS